MRYLCVVIKIEVKIDGKNRKTQVQVGTCKTP